MNDFNFLQKHLSKKWTILVPNRSNRPKADDSPLEVCPFCVGQEGNDELDRQNVDNESNEWLVRVIENKFPFALNHEIVIHSPDHHKNIDELPLIQVANIIKMYQKRFIINQKSGIVVIFHNRGEKAGESLPHPHTQIAVLPHTVKPDSASLIDFMQGISSESDIIETEYFNLFCPQVSEWPDEVIIAPKRRKERFSDINEVILEDLAKTLQSVLQSLSKRLGSEFPFNYSIYPLFDWYLRITPRTKVIGGFEIATNIAVVTKDPQETFSFLRENLGK